MFPSLNLLSCMWPKYRTGCTHNYLSVINGEPQIRLYRSARVNIMSSVLHPSSVYQQTRKKTVGCFSKPTLILRELNAAHSWWWKYSWQFSSHSVVGVPSAEDWPQEVALPQSAFTPRLPKPIEDLVPDMDEQGRALLMVGSTSLRPDQSELIMPYILYTMIL